MDKFVSKVSAAQCPASFIYNRFESLENFSRLMEADEITDVVATRDMATMNIKGIGPVGVQVVDREPNKTLKFSDVERKPIAYTFWLQLVEVNERDTRIRLTLHAKLPFMLRMMLKKKIQKGLDQMAERIASAFSY